MLAEVAALLNRLFSSLLWVLVQTTHADALTVLLQLPANVAVLAAVMRLNSEAAHGGEFAAAPPSMVPQFDQSTESDDMI